MSFKSAHKNICRLFEDLLSHSDDFLKHQGKADHFRGIHAEVIIIIIYIGINIISDR